MKRNRFLFGISLAIVVLFIGCEQPISINNEYTVTFVANSGTGEMENQTIASGESANLAANSFTKDGYYFTGWAKTAKGEVEFPDGFSYTMGTTNVALFAVWEVIPKYKVSFNSNGGTIVSDINNVIEGHIISKPVDPIKTDFTFAGWYKDSGFVTIWNFSTDTVTADTTIYANWTNLPTYTVYFNSNGGSSVSTISNVIEGHTISEPLNPTRTDYTFSGWYKDSGFETTWKFSTDIVTTDTTIYAKWTALPTYIVHFNANGGTSVSDINNVIDGHTISEPSDPTRTDFTFSGWYKDSVFGTIWNFSTDIVTANTTIYARWTALPTYIVHFNANGGTSVSDIHNVIDGHSISEPSDPTRTDFTFSGWYKDSVFGTIWNFSTDIVTANTIIYARWTALPTYKVSFNANGGTSSVSGINNVIEGHTISEPSDPTRTDYTFSGWYKDSGFGTAWNFSTDIVTADTTIYAKWTNLPTYSVRFDSNGGSIVSIISNVIEGHTISEPSDPTRTDFTFSGWYKDAGFGTIWNFSTDTITVNTTIYAKWTPLPTYSVNFETNGGTSVTTINNIIEGHIISEPANPAKAGNAFGGWYKDSGFLTVWDYSTEIVTADTTIFAKWIPNLYNISFDSNGGMGEMSNQFIYCGLSENLNTIEFNRPGYTFIGWSKTVLGRSEYSNGSSYTIGAANVTLYAKWQRNGHSVSFNGNTSTGGNTYYIFIYEGETEDLRENGFTKTGYHFSGWSTTPNGSIQYANKASYTMGEANVTLYAKWEINDLFTITFDGNTNDGGSTSSQSLVGGLSATLNPNGYSKIEHTFTGWSTTAGGAVEYTNEETFTIGLNNVILYAVWTENLYSITFDGNTNTGGSMEPQFIVFNSTADLNWPEFSKTGYSLSGWSTTANGSVEYPVFSSYTMGTEDVILYAIWTINPSYTITFNGNMNSNGTTSSMSIVQGLTASFNPNGFTRIDHTFEGWSITPNGPVVYEDEESYTMRYNDLTLYAKWRRDIGSFHAGGITIYVDETGVHGLVCAPFDQSSGIPWDNANHIFIETSNGIGTGASLTDTIVLLQGEGLYAAKICADLELNGFDDWFLPSMNTLFRMVDLYREGVGNFNSALYWSSSSNKDYEYYAAAYNFANGRFGWELRKSYYCNVRAVRAF